MNLDDLKDQLRDSFQESWENIQESSAYITLKEKFDDLPSNVQKGIIVGVIALIFLILITIPLSFLSTSEEKVVEFEDQKLLITELLSLKKEMASAPSVPPSTSAATLRSKISASLNSAGLLPEQIVEVSDSEFKSEKGARLIPANIIQNGVQVTLSKLNVRQIVNIGYNLQRSAPGVKVTAVDIKANESDDHYFDAMFRIVSFALPQRAKPPEDKKGRNSRRKPPSRNKGNE